MNKTDMELDFTDCQSLEKTVMKQVTTRVINVTKGKEIGF